MTHRIQMRAREFVTWRELRRNPMLSATELASLLGMTPSNCRAFCRGRGVKLEHDSFEGHALHAMPVDSMMEDGHSPQFKARFMSPLMRPNGEDS